MKNQFHCHHVFLTRVSERKSQISMFHKYASSNPTKILIVAMGGKKYALSNATGPQTRRILT